MLTELMSAVPPLPPSPVPLAPTDSVGKRVGEGGELGTSTIAKRE